MEAAFAAQGSSRWEGLLKAKALRTERKQAATTTEALAETEAVVEATEVAEVTAA